MIFAERYLSERFKAGVEQGRQEGFRLGREEGRQEGLRLGREEGRQEGLRLGREEGRREALKWLAQVEEAKRQGAEPPAPPWEQNGKMS